MRRRTHTAFALHRLEHDRGDVAALQLPLEREGIAEGHADATVEERLEGRAVADAPRHGESTEGRPVVAAVRGDEARPARRRTGQLEGALDGLGAAGAEGAKIEIARRDDGQALRQRRRKPLRRHEQEMWRPRLQHLFDRGAHVGVIVPERHRPVPGEKVEHLVAFVVPQRQALGLDEVPPEAKQVQSLDERRIQMLRVLPARVGGRE